MNEEVIAIRKFSQIHSNVIDKGLIFRYFKISTLASQMASSKYLRVHFQGSW